MTIPNLTLRNGSTILPLVPSAAYDVLSFDTGIPRIKSDVQAALEAGERVADGDWHEPCDRSLEVACKGATDEAAEASANTLTALLRRYGTVLEVAGSEPLSTTIRSVEITPREWDATTLIEREQGYIRYDIGLVTDPYWYGAEVDASGYALDAIPAQFAFDAIPGEVPALTRLKFTCDDDLVASGFLAIGLRSFTDSGDASGYDCIDDYSGVVDANAFGGQESANSPNLTATMQAVATAPNIDTMPNEGRYALFARVENTATAHTTVGYRAVSSVTGSAITSSTTVNGDTVGATLDNGQGFEVVALGEANVPAGAIPDVATGSGWSAEAVQAENAVDDGTKTLTSAAFETGQRLVVRQTCAVAAGERKTAYEYEIDVPPSGTTLVSAGLDFQMSNGRTVVTLAASDFAAGKHKILLSPPPIAPATETAQAILSLTYAEATPFTVGFAASNGDYAAGALDTPTGSGESAGDDLTFKVYGQTMLGFNTAITLQATDSAAASKVAQVDYLVRVPTDEGYACITKDFAAGQGIMLDESNPLTHKHNIYLADADGIGPSVLAQATEWRGSLMLRPGYNVYTVAAHTPAAAAPGGADVNVWFRPRYITCGS